MNVRSACRRLVEFWRFAGHVAHGGLLTAGLFALVVMAANQIEGGTRRTGLFPSALSEASAQTNASFESGEDLSEGAAAPDGVAQVTPALSREMAALNASCVFKVQRLGSSAMPVTIADAQQS